MAKSLLKRCLSTAVVLASCLLLGLIDANAQNVNLGCNFTTSDSVVGINNSKQLIYVHPNTSGNAVLGSVIIYDGGVGQLFASDGTTPLVLSAAVPAGAKLIVNWSVMATRTFTIYVRPSVTSVSGMLYISPGQLNTGSIGGYATGLTVSDILNEIKVDNGNGSAKIYTDPSMTTVALPSAILSNGFVLEATGADGLSKEEYLLSKGQDFVDAYFYPNATCSGTPANNVTFTLSGSPLFGVNYQWFVNGNNVGSGKGPINIHLAGGNYYAELRTQSKQGTMLGSSSNKFYVPGSLERFEVSTGDEACPNVPVDFNYNGPVSGSLRWDFGSGTFASVNETSKTFAVGTYVVRLEVPAMDNCPMDTITRTLTVKSGAKPFINPSANLQQACPGDEINLYSGNGWARDYTYSWNVNGEATKSADHFTYAFNAVGSKVVTLTATNSCGGVATASVNLTVGANIPANANFNYFQVGLACNSKTFQFEPQGSGSRIWDLGFGKTSTLARPIAQYPFGEVSMVPVKLLVTNGCGNTAAESKYVDLYASSNGGANLGFSIENFKVLADSIVIAPGERVVFSNKSNINSSVKYTWNFGDGITVVDNGQRVSHMYSDTITVPKKYAVTLSTQPACSSLVAKTLYVVVDPAASLSAIPLALPTRACVGDKVYFFDNNRGESDYTYSINFGDGISVNAISNMELPSLEVLRTHKYTDPGVYTYTFSAHSGQKTKTVQGVINVVNDNARTPFYYIENTTYRAEGQYFANDMTKDSVQYIKLSDVNELYGDYEMGYHVKSKDNAFPYSQGRFIRKNGKIILIEGTGPCSSDANYTFTIFGSKDSILFSGGSDLCATRYAFLEGKMLRYAASENKFEELIYSYACPNDSVRFVVAGASSIAWHLAGTNIVQSTIPETYYSYPNVGNYNAYAVVGNACGRVDTLYTKVTVSTQNKPYADFWVDVNPPAAGENIGFHLSGIENGRLPYNAKVLWNFGDGATSTLLAPRHTYAEGGAYKVVLQVTNGCGTRIAERDIIVAPGASKSPLAVAIDANPNVYRKLAGKMYRLDASSSRNVAGGTSGLLFTWYPPAGVTMDNTSAVMPNYILPTAPTAQKYTFKLKVTDAATQAFAWTFVEVESAPYLIANAGADIVAVEGTTVTLDGSGSLGNIMQISWFDMGGIMIQNPNQLVTSVVLPQVSQDSLATFVLQLMGGQDYMVSDTVRVTIKNKYDEFYVDPVNGSDVLSGTTIAEAFKTIDRAATAITSSGIINLLPGTYSGAGNAKLMLAGKDLFIRSTQGAGVTTITGSDDTLFVSIGGSRFCRVYGLTIKNFKLVAEISSEGNLQLLNNRFHNCSTVVQGGNSDGKTAMVAKRNVFYECMNPFYNVSSDSLFVKFNSFNYSTNTTGAVISMCYNSHVEVINNIVVGYSLGFDMMNTPYSVVSYNDIFNTITPVLNATVANNQMSLPPKFTDPVNLNFTLLAGSPCIDAGSPEFKYNDPDGSRADMGAVPTFRTSVTQPISLQRGWNILSTNVMPLKPNMLSVLEPLTSSNQLIKVMDEAGGFVEFGYDRWENSIGAISYTEGYLAKVSGDVVLNVAGAPVVTNFNIPVSAGWNIVGMPLSAPKDIVGVVQHIAVTDNGLKVQAQNGAAFEYIPNYGWVNAIGQLNPGQGYRVRVQNNGYLRYASTTVVGRSFQAAAVRSRSASYFSPAWRGNGFDHMNVYLSVDARLMMQVGDEVALFANGVCVGAAAIIDPAAIVPVVLSYDDPSTEKVDGFKDGDELTLQVYNQQADTIRDDYAVTVLPGKDLTARKGEGLLISLSPNGTTDINLVTGDCNTFEVYPNPADGEVKMTFTLAQGGEVSIDIFNLVGQKVAQVAPQTYSAGRYSIPWSGLSMEGDRIKAGLYLVRFAVGGQCITKRIVMK